MTFSDVAQNQSLQAKWTWQNDNSNDNNNNNTSVESISDDLMVFSTAICCIFLIVGITGNSITIIALARYRKLHNPTTALVINLSVADLLFSSLLMPLRLFMFNGTYNISCGIFLFLFYGSVTVSLMTMVAIALNRYVFVLTSHNTIFTTSGTAITIGCVWIYSFLLWSVPLTGMWGKFQSLPGTPFCRLEEQISSPKIFLALFGFVMPCATITVAYCAIFITIRKTTGILSKHVSPLDVSYRFRQREMSVTRMLLVSYLSFFLCFFPNFIILTVQESREKPIALIVGEILLWLSSCLNPLVYVLYSDSYRQAYKSLFRIGIEEKTLQNRHLRLSQFHSNSR